MQLLFEGGYISECGFYSNKYSSIGCLGAKLMFQQGRVLLLPDELASI